MNHRPRQRCRAKHGDVTLTTADKERKSARGFYSAAVSAQVPSAGCHWLAGLAGPMRFECGSARDVIRTPPGIIEVFGPRQRDLIVMCHRSTDETTTFHSYTSVLQTSCQHAHSRYTMTNSLGIALQFNPATRGSCSSLNPGLYSIMQRPTTNGRSASYYEYARMGSHSELSIRLRLIAIRAIATHL